MPALTEQGTTQGEHRLGAGTTPLHAGLFHGLLDDDFASRFDSATPGRAASVAKFLVTHAPTIVEEIEQSLVHGGRSRLAMRIEVADVVHNLTQVTVGQQPFLLLHPGY